MKKRIEDYLHLYLGCNVMVERSADSAGNTYKKIIMQGPYKLVAIDITNSTRKITLEGYNLTESDTIKPVLRPLSDMTEDEAIEFGWMRLFTLEHFVEKKLYRPESFANLLAKYFDLLDLIQEGVALDLTQMKNIVNEEPEYTLPGIDPLPLAGGTPGL